LNTDSVSETDAWKADFFTSLQKRKGVFQHSSFLAGGATSAAGRLVAENGVLKVPTRAISRRDS